MLSPVEKILFAILFIAANAAGAYTFYAMFRVINRGQGQINWRELPYRAWEGILALFSQGRIIRHRTWTSIFHYMVAYAFIFFLLVNVIDVLEGYIPTEGETHLIPGVIGNIYRLLADVLSVLGIIGVIYFLLRRFVKRDPALRARENVLLHPKARQGGISRDSLIVGLFIVFHLGARYVGASFLVAQHPDPWQPLATLLANAWSGLSTSGLNAGWHISWWLALGLILVFLPYFPFTKHAHLFMGPLNWATRPERTSPGELSTIDFDDESIEQFGVNTLFDLPQTAILDAFACIMCNRCQEACPAYATGKELSPAAIEINKRYHIRENLFALANGAEETAPMLDWALTESALWACTSCGACVDVCPVGNEPMQDILAIRRDRVLMQSDFPNELKQAFTGMERLANPWNSTESRTAWTEGLDFAVPTVEENPDYEYLFWVGCAGAFDPDAQDVARAVATILHHA
ncbi:MAG: (Fe-S)-binding protein, partial [Anaerolineales bacterium]|nr:(Fe-S)-binding protein [Anaerolineales bacterium]